MSQALRIRVESKSSKIFSRRVRVESRLGRVESWLGRVDSFLPQNGAQPAKNWGPMFLYNLDSRLFRSTFFVKVVSILLLSFALSHFNKTSWILLQENTSWCFTCPKITRDEHGPGFGSKSCRILVFCRISIIYFQFNQIWMGFDNILLNFFTTFGSVLGLQLTLLNGLVQWSVSNLLRLHRPIVFVCWAMSMTSETSVLFYISCHQSYTNSLTFIDPVSFDSLWL